DASTDVSWSVEQARWSLDGRYVAAIRTDATGVARFPIMHWLKPLEEVEWVPYSKSGWRQASRALCVIDTVSGAVRSVELERSGEDIFALQPLVFDREGRLLFLVSDRRNKVLELRRADAQSGTSAVLIEERQETFVYGINLAAMLTVATPLPDGRHLVWMSERDGWRHAYLYTLDGTLVRALTSGDFEVDRVAGTDNVNGRIYLVARSDVARPYDQHLCVVGLDGTSFRQLTTDPGVHSPMVSPSGATIVDIHSGVARPPRTDLLTPDGDVVKTLARAETDRLDELGYEPPEQFVTLALDGVTPIHGAMYLPPRFDAAKRYPVVEYIYAGPQVSLFPNDYSGPSLARLLAQVGFIGVVLDAPGTPGRGKRFQDAVAGRFGQFEIEEHANALRQLGDRHPFLDLTRVGIVGGSWGGYNSVRALLRAPDTYHAGVAIYPVADCMDHIGTAIEPYLGLPQDDPAAYAAASSLPLVDRLRGKLYLIHGTSDVNAPFSATMQLVDAFIKANKPVDLLAIPEMDHSMAGSAGAYVIDRMAEYFAEHLGSARSASPSA
ncbi:MAG: hypothetical protein QOE84_2318, partial [Actinomycetota bacterium]|nr:hypothetical protein [Actinomycetota bacterium]